MRGVITLLFGVLLCKRAVSLHHVLVSSLKQPVTNILSSYVNLLSTKPMVTNVVTASALAVFSDSISQKAEQLQLQSTNSNTPSQQQQQQQHSWYRSLCMAIYGATVYGYLIIYWFKFLNMIVPQEGITRAKVVLKVCINQLVMSPLLNSLFFTWVCCTRDLTSTWPEKIAQTKLKLSRDLIPTIKRSCAYW